MLTWLTATAACALSRTCFISNSMPTANMNRQTPIWLNSRSVSNEAGAKTNENAPGARKPNREGPSRIPAAISPTTAGWPSRAKTPPMMRDAPMMTRSWMNSRLRGCSMFVRRSLAKPVETGADSVGAEAWTTSAPAGSGNEAPWRSTLTMAVPAARIIRT